MRLAFFCHSILSDWNHGNAHFLRGLTTELRARGHRVEVFEPRNSWSLENLLSEQGPAALEQLARLYPGLTSTRYDLEALDLDEALDGVDLAIVHEWNDQGLVARLGEHRRRHPRLRLLFHDTHHRSVTERAAMAAYDLSAYDGVLAFGRVIRDLYLAEGWARRAWVFHEAADHHRFRQLPDERQRGDLIWIGNWGDDERTAELHEFFIEPVRQLGLRATAHGVRYPETARAALASAGIAYAGWLASAEVPASYARHLVTVHVPRRPYATRLPGIPTIRVFEALACGIPLVCAPWDDAEGLFTPGQDYLCARDGAEMTGRLRELIADPGLRADLAAHGRRTILARHTCGHRADELLAIAAELGAGA